MPLCILLSRDDDIIQSMECPYRVTHIYIPVYTNFTARFYDQDNDPDSFIRYKKIRFNVSDTAECLAYQLLYNRPDVYVYRQELEE